MLNDAGTTKWDAGRNCLWFQVDHRGRNIPCCIDALCLYLAFGARTLSEGDATDAYEARRGWIHAAAIGKAGRGGFQNGPDRGQAFVHLTARDL